MWCNNFSYLQEKVQLRVHYVIFFSPHPSMLLHEIMEITIIGCSKKKTFWVDGISYNFLISKHVKKRTIITSHNSCWYIAHISL